MGAGGIAQGLIKLLASSSDPCTHASSFQIVGCVMFSRSIPAGAVWLAAIVFYLMANYVMWHLLAP